MFAANMLVQSFNAGSLQSLAEITILIISDSTPTSAPTYSYLPTGPPSNKPTPGAAPSTGATSGPTEVRVASTIQIGYATIGDAVVSERNGRRRQTIISMEFRAVAGASKYMMQLRSALPSASLSVAENTTALSKARRSAARRANKTSAIVRSLANAHTTWAPTLDVFTSKDGRSQFRLLWTDVDYSASTEFYTVWFRDIDARRPQPLRCLTSNEDADSPRPHLARDADGCLNTSSSSARSSACFPFPSQRAAAGASAASASSSTFTISPFSLWNAPSLPSAADLIGLRDVCRFEAQSHKIQAFVVACRGSAESPSCNFDKPSRSLLLEISCEARVKVLLLEDNSVQLSLSSCIQCATLNPYGEHCQDPDSGVDWSDWECAKDAYDKGCLEVTKPEAEITLSMCDHRTRYNFRAVACFNADCDESAFTDDVFEFEFEHPSGARADECWPKPSREATTAGTAVVAVVGGTIAATIGATVLPTAHSLSVAPDARARFCPSYVA
jgi:hypothetical protein